MPSWMAEGTAFDDGRTIATFTKKQRVFAQGDPSDAVFYIQNALGSPVDS
jgi:hypothetical protein